MMSQLIRGTHSSDHAAGDGRQPEEKLESADRCQGKPGPCSAGGARLPALGELIGFDGHHAIALDALDGELGE